MWWVLIIGKILSLLYYLFLIKYYCNLLSLQDYIFDLDWFNFILESHKTSVGKFFIVNEEFRIFIKNLFIIYINIFIWPLIITFFEFCLIITILSYFLYFLLTYVKYENTKFSLTILIFHFYSALIFFFKSFEVFTFLDLYYISIILLTSCLTIGICYYIFFNINIFYVYIFKYRIKKQNKLLNFFIIKLFICIFFLVILINLTMVLLNQNSNNFIQEFVINFLLIYSYLYYKF